MPDVDITNLKLPRTWVTAQPDNPAFDISADELGDELRALGDLDFGANKLQNVLDPTLDQDVATKKYVDTGSGGPFLPLAGGTMTGLINMTDNGIEDIGHLADDDSIDPIADSGFLRMRQTASLLWRNIAATGNFGISGTVDGSAADVVKIGTAHFQIDTLKKLYLDGGANTYLTHGASDVIDFYTNDLQVARFSTNFDLYETGSGPPTTLGIRFVASSGNASIKAQNNLQFRMTTFDALSAEQNRFKIAAGALDTAVTIIGTHAGAEAQLIIDGSTGNDARLLFRENSVARASLDYDATLNKFELASSIAGEDIELKTNTGRIVVTTSDMSIPTAKPFFLDGGGDTWIEERATNVIQFVVGGEIGASNNGMFELNRTTGNLDAFNDSQVNFAFRRILAVPATGTISVFDWYDQNLSDASTLIGQIKVASSDLTAGTHAGTMDFNIANNAGGVLTYIKLVGAGTDRMRLMNAHVDIDQGKRLRFSNNGNTYIVESSDDVLDTTIGGTIRTRLTATLFDFSGIPIAVDATQKIFLDAGGNTSIRESAADVMTFEIAGTDRVDIDGTNFTITGLDISLGSANGIKWAGSNNRRIINASGGTTLEVETDDFYRFEFQNVVGFELDQNTLEVNTIPGRQVILTDTATDGFLYIPYSSTGAFTGTPTAYTGKSAFGFDQTNDNLMVYDVGEGAWKSIGGAGGGEVFVWTAAHDANGFDFILDADGDLKWRNNVDDKTTLETTAATTAPTLGIFRNEITTAGQAAGILEFEADDAGGGRTVYAEMIGFVRVNTAGSEDGQLRVRLVQGGSLTSVFSIRADTDIAEFQNIDMSVDPLQKIFLDGGGDTYIHEPAGNVFEFVAGGTISFKSDSTKLQAFIPIEQYETSVFGSIRHRFDTAALGTMGDFEWESDNSLGTNRSFARIRGVKDVATDGGEASTIELKVRTPAAGTLATSFEIDGNASLVEVLNNFDLTIEQQSTLYFDGGLHTFIEEFLNDDLRITVGGTLMLRIDQDTLQTTVTEGSFSVDPLQKIFFDNNADTSIRESAANIITFEAGGNDIFSASDIGVSSAIATGGSLNFPNLAIFAFEAASGLKQTFQFTNSDTFRYSSTDDRVIFETHRNEVVANDTTIANFRFRGEDDAGAIKTFASFDCIMREDNVATGVDGSWIASVMENNTLTEYIELSGPNATIEFSKPLAITGGDIIIDATQKIFLDGGSNTYITEETADLFKIYTGGSQRLNVSNTGTTIVDLLRIGATSKIFLDGDFSGDTSIRESAANIITLEAGGEDVFNLLATGLEIDIIDAITTGGAGGLTIKHTTSGDMATGFGESLDFVIEDPGATELNASIRSQRAGADNAGKLQLRVNTAGTMETGIEIFSTYVHVRNGRDLVMDALERIFLDGTPSGDTFMVEQSADDLEIQVGGEIGLKLEEIGTEINSVFGALNVLAVGATDGFMNIPTMAGTPTAAPPTTYTGKVPMVYDTTNDVLYVFNSSWKGVNLN